MEDEVRKLKLKFQTYMKMTISLAKNLDKLEEDADSIKKAVEGFDGRMLIMAVRIVELQEKIERIDESLQQVISLILESENEYKKMGSEAKLRQQESQLNLNSVEYEQAINEFLLKLEEKGMGNTAT
jgi:chromosome segregation ATPase